ncbi:MAG TPA: LysR substrate-binding domain-containing protein, partial [Accumulibacter sp.]|nr:LysR substrate-binding domain-containing protein [Accumulibacter sp.]
AERAMTIEHRPRLVTSDMHTLRQAALTGLGVVQLPRAFVQQDLLNGRLLMLLPNWQAPPQLIHAVFVSRRGLLSSVRALLGHLADGFSVLKP